MEQITDKIQNQLIQAQSDKIDDIQKDVKTLLRILLGNGKIGIVAKVNILWNSILFLITAVIIAIVKVFVWGAK